ncbi:molybdopterin-dependent oxidoreductase [Adhaeribacter swui]|uniref:Molybdopterin-dependent oxidoreductase n=1 Tax=Adhaeribacter swui TaxID=2086471 RepID=A0A7G7G7E9_9BACT|nr:molybdopterin-dependent oxidoreductase [Adhaeribacter swui]QNF33083.1 molybdopterin-dependent oxidoreductase [Adhaeribacter swui]
MKNKFFLLVFTAWLSSFSLRAQTAGSAPSFRVEGEVTTPLTLTLTDLDKMEKTTVQATDRQNKVHSYSGVLLATILKKAGATLGEELKGENLTKYLLLEASDGYQVLFSLAEVDEAFSDKKIILANRMDGSWLKADQGPFQIIVEGEKKKARHIRQVNRLQVYFAK